MKADQSASPFDMPIDEAMLAVFRATGDLPGHEFHGNQWTGGRGTVLDAPVTIFHQTEADESILSGSGGLFFGGASFQKSYPKEFGTHLLSLTLPKGARVLDLNQETPEARAFKLALMKQAWPKDASISSEMTLNPDEVYEAWTDKKNILAALKNLPYEAVKYQDEYLVPKTTARKHRTIRTAGDLPGHEFHGNQWTGGMGGLDALFKRISQPDGGFTYHTVTGTEPTTGYVLSIHKDREQVIEQKDLTPADLAHYTEKNADLLVKSDNFFGGWHDPDSHKIFFDVSRVVETAAEAEQLARDNDQLAYFDLAQGKSVPVGSLKVNHGQKTRTALARILGWPDGTADARRHLEDVHEAQWTPADGRRDRGYPQDHRRTRQETRQKVRLAVAHPEGPLHKVANKHEPKLSVAFRYAFARARKALGPPSDHPNIDAAVAALRKALKDVLPATLVKAMAEGGQVALGALRTLGDVEGHEFHGNQWTGGMGVTRTPEFKAWFGKSKVVNSDGSPKVMYHATTADITEFRPFTHFGTREAAEERNKTLTTFYDETLHRSDRSMGANTVPVYLSVEHPLRMPDLAGIDELTGNPLPENWDDAGPDDAIAYPRGWEGEEAIAQTLLEMGKIDIDEFEEHRSNTKALELLKEKGYDGIVYRNEVEDAGKDSWIVFDPSQIKSAIGNSGKFSRTSRLITSGDVEGHEFHGNQWTGGKPSGRDVANALDQAETPDEIRQILKEAGAEPLRVNGMDVQDTFITEDHVVEWNGEDRFPSVSTKEEWVNQANVTDYYPDYEDKLNEDFWSGGGKVYHATTDENVESIEKYGLEPRNQTRGISNRSEGPAVFTTTDIEETELGSYGDVVYAIDIGAMAKDGYKPYTSQEPDIVEGELRGALAHAVELTNYEYGYEQGMSPYTVAIHGNIPAKYLKRVDGAYRASSVRPRTLAVRVLGDVEGHPFHGNQWTTGTGSAKPEGNERDPHNIVNRLRDRATREGQPVTITQEPTRTRLILPDGTRLGSPETDHPTVVAAALQEEGQGKPPNLEAVLEAGVVRYAGRFGGGIEIKVPLTAKQADIIADDWNYTYKTRLYVDMSSHGYGEYMSATFDPPFTSDALRNWSRVSYRKLNAELKAAGGPGSGNFGHEGRPGEVGGSAESGSAPEIASAEHLRVQSEQGIKNVEKFLDEAVKTGHFATFKVPVEDWDDVDSDVQTSVYDDWYENASSNGVEVDTSDIQQEFERDLRRDNEEVIKETETELQEWAVEHFKDAGPALPIGEPVELAPGIQEMKDVQFDLKGRELDLETITYDDDDGDGAHLVDLENIRFANGDIPTAAELDEIAKTWDEIYEADFNVALQKSFESTAYYDQVSELEQQALDDEWNSMSDSQKLDLYNEGNYDRGKSKTVSAEVPTHWMTGINSNESTSSEDYVRTHAIANAMTELRTEEISKERGVEPMNGSEIREVWESWKGSSTSETAKFMQYAAALELGGVHRLTNAEVKDIKDLYTQHDIERMKAYVRAQWEVSQFVMSKAGQDHVDVYRAMYLTRDEIEQARTESVLNISDPTAGGRERDYYKLPDVSLKRNGAQSTTGTLSVANDWGHSPLGRDRERVVLRIRAPRTSVLSLPVFGVNSQAEHELVLLGTKDKWKWDLWKRKAPPFEALKVLMRWLTWRFIRALAQKTPRNTTVHKTPTQKPKRIVIDFGDIDRGQPHWMENSLPAIARAKRARRKVRRVLGDLPGHEFHGNQWTTGQGGSSVGAVKSYADLEKKHNVRRIPVADIPTDVRTVAASEGSAFTDESVEPVVARGIDDALTQLRTVNPDLYKLVQDRVRFVGVRTEPSTIGQTIVRDNGQGEAYFGLNLDTPVEDYGTAGTYGVVDRVVQEEKEKAELAGKEFTDKEAYELGAKVVTLHELGHAIDKLQNPGSPLSERVKGAVIDMTMNDHAGNFQWAARWMDQHLSEYATVNPNEATAEAIAMTLMGRALPPELKFVEDTIKSRTPVSVPRANAEQPKISPDLLAWINRKSKDLIIIPSKPGASLRSAKDTRDKPKKDVGPFRMRFDMTNQRVIDWADRHAAELIDGISETTREDINNAVAEAFERGTIKDLYDDVLDAVGDENRAELIARTEAMTAVNEGQREGWDQAVESGYLAKDARVAWIATGDDGVCDLCDELDGKERDLDGEYPNDGGDGPPLHPRCRCTEGIVS